MTELRCRPGGGSGLFKFLRPLCRSHLIGFLVGFAAFQTMLDMAAAEASIPAGLGFRWQAGLLGATPILCVLGCLAVFVVSPVGNRSQYRLARRIGAIPVLGRYCLFAGVVCCTVLLGIALLGLCTSSSIQSLKLEGDVSPLSSLPSQVMEDVGDGVTFRWRGDETVVFFRKEKRAAVLRTLEKEHVTFVERGW